MNRTTILFWIALLLSLMTVWTSFAQQSELPVQYRLKNSAEINRPSKKTAAKILRSAAYSAIKTPINSLLNGTIMRPIENCPEQSCLKPENIHLVTLASPSYLNPGNPYFFGLESVHYYASLHGYHYHIVDPISIMKVHGAVNPDLPKREVVASKALIMQCK